MAKLSIPRTRQQNGRMWASLTIVLCGAFSIYANVRSGQINRDSIIVSVVPPIVAYVTSHLIGYFGQNKSKTLKRVIYGGFGAICVIAMYASGWHIFDFVLQTGQHWTTAISYVFITDAPMLLAAGILVEKVSTARSATTQAVKTTPAKVAKAAPVAKTTGTATNRTRATKTTKPTIVPTFVGPAIVDETADIA